MTDQSLQRVRHVARSARRRLPWVSWADAESAAGLAVAEVGWEASDALLVVVARRAIIDATTRRVQTDRIKGRAPRWAETPSDFLGYLDLVPDPSSADAFDAAEGDHGWVDRLTDRQRETLAVLVRHGDAEGAAAELGITRSAMYYRVHAIRRAIRAMRD